MEVVKKNKDVTIFKKRNKRFAVKGVDNKWINGDEKAQILAKYKLIKLSKPKKKEEAPAPEEAAAPAETPSEEKTEDKA